MYGNTIIFKFILYISIFSTVLLMFYFTFILTDRMKEVHIHKNNIAFKKSSNEELFNVWLIFTKAKEKSPLTYKFKSLLQNILNVTSVPLQFHIIVDENSKKVVRNFMNETSGALNLSIKYHCYDVKKAAFLIQDIVSVMTPHFSSKPGTYFSDALFYLSLGLHRIAPRDQEKAILLDCDLIFKEDIALLFNEFNKFSMDNLLGVAPELTPVYRHVFHKYRSGHRNTSLGEYFRTNPIFSDSHPYGYQGYNSGVMLLNLASIRKSVLYEKLLKAEYVDELVEKYSCKGHLGDQDFYTLLGYEHQELIYNLDCKFNRQLCLWWSKNGYKSVFDDYFKCLSKIVVMHGNCNTKIPSD